MKTCKCGCGEEISEGKVFIQGHNGRGTGAGKPRINHAGYISFYSPNHPFCDNKKHVKEHRLVVEKAMGRYLKPTELVHHFDEVKHNNENTNLVVCGDEKYHNLLHRRKRAYDTCGHANWLKCRHCEQYDDPKNMYIKPNGYEGRHRECFNEYQNKRKLERQ